MTLIAKEINLVGSFRFTHEFNTAVDWLARGVVNPLPLFSGSMTYRISTRRCSLPVIKPGRRKSS